MPQDGNIIWRINRIRTQVPIYRFFEWVGHRVQPSTREHQIRCPFFMNHSSGMDANPSARVYPDDNAFYCFAEGKSRDLLDCVQQWWGKSLIDSVKYVEAKVGLKVDGVRVVRQKLESVTQVKGYTKPQYRAEKTIRDLYHKACMYLTGTEKLMLDEIMCFIWSEFDVSNLQNASQEKQVEWEVYAKSMMKSTLQQIKEIRAFHP